MARSPTWRGVDGTGGVAVVGGRHERRAMGGEDKADAHVGVGVAVER